jgi:DNA-binding beta-propeller fold protein YncE
LFFIGRRYIVRTALTDVLDLSKYKRFRLSQTARATKHLTVGIPMRIFTNLLFLVCLTFSTAFAQTTPTPNPALIVGEKSGGLLSIIDPATLQIVTRVEANRSPHEVATDGRYAYITNSGALAITVIDLATQQQVEGIDMTPLGSAHGLVARDGKIYFANENARTIARYNPETKTIDWVLGTGLPRSHMFTFSPDGRTIFTGNTAPGTIGIIERAPLPAGQNTGGGGQGGNQAAADPSRPGGPGGDWVISSVETGPRPEGLDVTPDGRYLWVANTNDSTISIIDVPARERIEKFRMPTAFTNRIKITPDGRYAVIPDLEGTAIVVYDVATRDIVKTIDVGGGAEGLLITPDGSRLFVAVSRANKIAVVDLNSLTVIGEIPDLNNPDGMAWVVSP